MNERGPEWSEHSEEAAKNPAGGRPQPYHIGPPLPSGERRGRLLLVSWHFPPSQAAGALRWQKFSRFAAERGWELDVIALAPDELSNSDPARLDELPPGLRAFGVPTPEPVLDRLEQAVWRIWRWLRRGPTERPMGKEADGQEDGIRPEGSRSDRPNSFSRQDVAWSLGRPRGWARAWWAWRQHAGEAAWARAAARLGARLHQRADYRAVITCGPPHMVHEAGRLLARRLDLPFIMDLRDPWSLQQRLLEPVASPLWYRLAHRGEARCVERAELVIGNTEPAAEAMRKAYPQADGRIIAVMNGYDDAPLPPSPDGGPFLLAYLGTIYLDRDPRPLFRAVGKVVRELEIGPAEFRIKLVGNVNDYGGVPIDRMAREEGIEKHLSTGPLLPRREALELMARATVLVSLPQDSDLAIPSKVFEYMRFPAWILVMADRESATGLVLQGTGADVVSPEDVDRLAEVLRHRYREYVTSGRPAPAAESGGTHLSRRHQAEKLLNELERRSGSGALDQSALITAPSAGPASSAARL